jgi:hypothetical protein
VKLPGPEETKAATPGACCLLPANVVEGQTATLQQRAYRKHPNTGRKFPKKFNDPAGEAANGLASG